MSENKIAVALDRMALGQACELVRKTHHLAWGYKVNDLLFEAGIGCISALKKAGAKNVFADPKILDIPNTALNTARRLHAYGADLITAHAIGGHDMLAAADEAAPGKILAVSALTSYEDEEFLRLYNRTRQEYITMAAALAQELGLAGVVLSGQDLPLLADLPEKFLRVVPGVRAGEPVPTDDQVKVSLPKKASLVVVGRPVTLAKDPVAALENYNRLLRDA